MKKLNSNPIEDILADWDKVWEDYKVDDNTFNYMFACASLLQQFKDLYDDGKLKYKF